MDSRDQPPRPGRKSIAGSEQRSGAPSSGSEQRNGAPSIGGNWDILTRYRGVVQRYRGLIENQSKLVTLGNWVMFQAREGLAILRDDGSAVMNRRFRELCAPVRRAVCEAGELGPGEGTLQDRLLERGQDLLAAAGKDGSEQRLLLRIEPGPRFLEVCLRCARQERPLQATVEVRDVTDTVTLRREREEPRRREQFLAMLAHELRNPLAPILTGAEIVLRHTDDPVVRTEADRILRQGRHQALLLDALLDAARVRTGKIVLQRRRVDLREMMGEAVEATAAARGASIGLVVRLPDEPVWVDGDSTRLQQCVVNLLNNAATYTPAGGRNWVELEVGQGTAWVRVRDNGVGISAADLAQVFEVFSQAEQTLDRSQGGLGLGLALVRSLMELHGGGVRASSEGLGQGAEFTLWLSLAAPQAAQERAEEEGLVDRPAPTPVGAPKLVLLVEDNADVRECLEMLLTEIGFVVQTAVNGKQGVQEALRLHPDAIVADLGLPLLDGFELGRRVRAELPGVRLVALSGYSGAEYQERARASGFDRYLVKPANIDALVEALGLDVG